MKKFLAVIFFIFSTGRGMAQTLKIVTYNIRLDLKSDGVNAWDQRKDFLTDQLKFYEPDLFGIQEALPNQVQDIARALAAYQHLGVGRESNNTGEASAIFFKKDRFLVLDSGTFWLSETPAIVSKGWDATYKRICTYALFADKKSGKQFWMFNTHLDNVGQVARTEGIQLILHKMKELNKVKLPLILTGDFNTEPSEPLIQDLRQKMTDTRLASIQKPFGPAGSFNGFLHNEAVTRLIDYIFISHGSRWTVEKYAILSDSRDLRYPSDHLPVFVELNEEK